MVISYNRLLCLLRAEILYLIFKPFIDIYVLQELWLFRMFKNKTKSNDILVIRCIDKCHRNLQGYIRLWRFHTKSCCMVLLLKKKLSKSFVLIKLIKQYSDTCSDSVGDDITDVTYAVRRDKWL